MAQRDRNETRPVSTSILEMRKESRAQRITENEVSIIPGIPPCSICEHNEIHGKFVLYFVVLIKGIGGLRD